MAGFFPRFSLAELERRYRLVRDMMRNRTAGIGAVNYLCNYISWMPTYLIFPLEGKPTLYSISTITYLALGRWQW